jgi:hypothetical protein
MLSEARQISQAVSSVAMATDATELRRLTQEFKNSPGFKVHTDINNAKRSLRIVSRNKDELLQSIATVKRQAVATPAMNLNDSPSLLLALEELARRLENFVSSVYDLVDYARRYSRRMYEKTEFAKEIQSEIDKRFIFEPDYKLAQGLRSASSHVDSLQPSLNPAPNGEKGQDAPYKVHVKQLLAWDEWNDNQRKMLESMKDDVDLQEFSERYFAGLEEFYAWLWKRQGEIHSEELRKAEELRLRAKDAYDKLFPATA